MAKKKLLFVIESLTLGGAEKSLVTLLNLFDYSKYDVDLLLFSQGGEFQQLLPEEVKLLPVPDQFEYASIAWKRPFKKLAHPLRMASQIGYSVLLRMKRRNHIEKAVLFWKTSHRRFGRLAARYDAAIAYAQGVPTFFVADKVEADQKLAWVNATYRPTGAYKAFIGRKYDAYDFVNCVSTAIEEDYQKVFGIDAERTVCIMDILDVGFALKMSEIRNDASAEMNGDGVKILTVGRICKMKRYDLAADAAKLLKERGVRFTWYVIGDGALRGEIEKRIAENGIGGQFLLLGSRRNPYPYFKRCDLYVQTSDFEGFGITVSEAKMFRKPIVSTDFPAVGAQLENEYDGLIVNIDARSIADGIERMIEDKDLRDRCISNIGRESLGNTNEIKKLYKLIDG